MRATITAKRKQKALSASRVAVANDVEAATLLSHVRELQIRLLITAAVLVAAGVVAYLKYPQILDILRKPLNAPLYISSVSGSFAFVMKICLVAGIAVSVPLIVYNFIMFVRPAFIEVFTRKRVFMMTLGSVVAAAGGGLFAYFFIIPGAIHFFNGFHVNGLNTMIQADGYLNFVVNVFVTFILMFQLPIIVSLIDRIKPIPPRAMWKGEKWALVGSIIISLVVPFAMDIMTQVLIAAPIFLLYNISFVVVAFQHRYARKIAKKAAKIEAKTVKREAQAASKPFKRPSPSMPVTAAQVIQPHPQLAEVLALQASQKAPAQKPAKAVLHAKPAAAVHAVAKITPRPVNRAVIVQQAPATVTKPAVQPASVSMDGMTRPVAVNRAQPANVIRQAGTIKAPERRVNTPLRSLNMMADIR